MKTAEEILEDHYTQEFGHIKESILMAMDEFATAFTFWVTKYYFRKSEEDIWFNGCDLLGEEPLTTAQLLKEYKNDFKKLPALTRPNPPLFKRGDGQVFKQVKNRCMKENAWFLIYVYGGYILWFTVLFYHGVDLIPDWIIPGNSTGMGFTFLGPLLLILFPQVLIIAKWGNKIQEKEEEIENFLNSNQ